MLYTSKKIETFPINKIIEKLDLYSNVSDKEEFINKYNQFLSKHYF